MRQQAAINAAAVTRKVTVIQGGHFVSQDANVILSTVLGSCIACCMRDPVAGVGGMNHFLLGEGQGGAGDEQRYGAYAMEVLINALLARGAQRHRLEAKLFGGARMLGKLLDIGASNASFAREFLTYEGISIVGESLGGASARRVEFWPVSGRARQRVVATDEATPLPQPKPKAEPVGELELF